MNAGRHPSQNDRNGWQSRPRLRDVEILPVTDQGDPAYLLEDPQGFSQPVVVPYGAALAAALMDGRRSHAEIQAEFSRRLGSPLHSGDLGRLVEQLDEAYLLDSPRFAEYRRDQVQAFLDTPVRPAAHAGSAYSENPAALKRQLRRWFRAAGAKDLTPRPGAARTTLRGLVSPHIDPQRGGAAMALAYHTLARESRADLFVIFGTAHSPMGQLFSISRKDFETPLGRVPTDQSFIDRVAEHASSSVMGREMDLFADQIAHRFEHSIEFQVLFLQHALQRDFRIVPVLVGSFHEFIQQRFSPHRSPQFAAFVAAVRSAAEQHSGEVCYVSGADFAHIGQRFGDAELLTSKRLAELAADDRRLLDSIARGDGPALFDQVAAQKDRNRICGLSPTCTLLDVLGPVRGSVLAYDQAVEADHTSCVSFASVALYG